jgi:hypothetical protein
VREGDVVENIARNFARQPEKESALALLDRAENPRRGTVRAMQTGKQGLEQREAEGKTRATLIETFARQRDNRAGQTAAQTLNAAEIQRRTAMDRLRDFTKSVRTAVRQTVEHVRQLRENRAQAERQERSRSRARRR